MPDARPVVGELWAYTIPGMPLPAGTPEQVRAWVLASPQPRAVRIVGGAAVGDVWFMWWGQDGPAGYYPARVSADGTTRAVAVLDVDTVWKVGAPTLSAPVDEFVKRFTRLR